MIALWLAGCPKPPPAPAAAAGPAPRADLAGRDWRSPLHRDHPLVGVVWSVGAAAPGTWAELVADADAAQWLFLGEKHDNPDHHLLQAAVLAAVGPGAVVFEHLDHEDPVGDATTTDAIAEASRWADSGWPPFDEYRPIFEAALAAHARIVPGHPTRAEVKAVMTDGFGALPAEATAGLPLDHGLPDALRADLAAEVVDSHCGFADEALVEKMIRAQQLKDTWMARAMREAHAATPAPTALVAGNGHTRGDRGVPFWIDDRAEGAMVTVSFVEVTDETDPTRVDPEGADWLVFTPRHDDDDPCAAFRK